MKALGSYIVLKREKEEVKKKSGLIMTEYTEKDIRYKLAEIISVGDSVVGLERGDKVYYDFAAASPVRIEGEKLEVVHDRQVVMKL